MSFIEKKPNQPKTPPRISVGHPCQNCPHSHTDHSMYSRQCLIDECICTGLKLDVKPL